MTKFETTRRTWKHNELVIPGGGGGGGGATASEGQVYMCR